MVDLCSVTFSLEAEKAEILRLLASSMIFSDNIGIDTDH